MFSKLIKIIISFSCYTTFSLVLILVFLHSSEAYPQAIPDSVKIDTVKVVEPTGALRSKVEYSATDSIQFDVKTQTVYLYGNAEVSYEDINLKAAFIEVNWSTETLFAKGAKDSTGKDIGLPVFSENNQNFTAYAIRYNFNSKKGKITQVTTQEGEGYIHGENVKKDEQNNFYIKNGVYTTCNLDTPHYYIGARKLKVIQDDKVITGPAYLVIENVPTPFAIPFGYFPNKKGQVSGILIPSYGESTSLGFYLSNGGYYFGINDYLDLTLKGDIYTKGSWKVNTSSNYNKRYRYQGNLNLGYAITKLGEEELSNYSKSTDFFIRWNHRTDPKARPNSTFTAKVNAGSNSYFQNTSYNANDYLSNTFSSSVSYAKAGAGKPYNFSLNATHEQNNLNKTVNVTLPHFMFGLNRLYPFKSKNSVEPKWYHKIGVSYSADARNTLSTTDSLLFKEESLTQLKNGMQHVIPVSTSFKLFKYFSLSPSFNYTERWYLKTIEKHFDTTANRALNDTVKGFKAARDFSFSTSFSTRVYGMLLFKKGPLKAIRHVITPSTSFAYRPDFGAPEWGYYQYVKSDILGTITPYSIFETGIYGGPSMGRSGTLSFNIDNNLEMKVKSKRDTISGIKKIKLLESFNVGTSYNLAADSLNWSSLNINGRTVLFEKININFSGIADPYVIDSLGKRLNKFELKENSRIARLTNANLSIGFSLNKKAVSSMEKKTPEQLSTTNINASNYVDFSIPWNLSVNYSLYYTKTITETVTQSLNFNGDVNLTPKWKIGFTSGYDFINEDFTYTTISIYRDLHCWEMSFTWIPFGFHQSYNFQINVKASILRDLKLNRKRDWYDNL